MDHHLNTSNLTAIIPVKIDSPERERNVYTVVAFLQKFYDCKIIIKHVDAPNTTPLFTDTTRLRYVLETETNPKIFHRTKILNDMLAMVDTPFVVNYDCDILIPQDSLNRSMQMLHDGYDLVYPYDKGKFLMSFDFNESHRGFYLKEPDTHRLASLLSKSEVDVEHNGLDWCKEIGLGMIRTCGGIQFFRTDSYRSGGGENEEFIDWGPEDQERLYRFHVLGYKIGWVENSNICHINHPKTKSTHDTEETHRHNHAIWQHIQSTIHSKPQMIAYMNSRKVSQ